MSSTVESHPTADRRCAVLGSPVAHSLSPLLHRAGYAAAGLTSFSYRAIECDAESLPGLVGSFGPEWVGLSVTMPGKAAAARVADRRSARVELLGVANTLVRRNITGRDITGGEITGGDIRGGDITGSGSGWAAENTDVDGVIGALRGHGVCQPGRVLLLGGGGTALSVVAALTELGAGSLVVAGRRPESRSAVVQLAGRTGLPVQQAEFTEAAIARAAAEADLVVSTVPAGAADPLAAALAAVPALFDVIYHPWPTPLAAAGPPGRTTITGLDMLLHQALAQFRLFTGHPAPAAAMRDALLAAAGGGLALPLLSDEESDELSDESPDLPPNDQP